MVRYILFVFAAVLLAGFLSGCMTPQERSGYNPKPFNSPAAWELNPYGGQFQN